MLTPKQRIYMTDRELLELAAKAAGYNAFPSHAAQMIESGWNPLTDDGDALRIAADLRIEIKPGKHLGDGCTAESQRSGVAGCTCFRDDKREQMRHAIVRAAAEIGKAMEGGQHG